MLGVMSSVEALKIAEENELDLVMIAPTATPPVCKVMDYGKYKFEEMKREKEAKKKQKTIEIKEIRVSPNIEQHDFDFKVKNAMSFLKAGNKVKITLKFKGREAAYASLGEKVLNNFAQALEDGVGQGSLACCSPWGHKESDTTERLNNNCIAQGTIPNIL